MFPIELGAKQQATPAPALASRPENDEMTIQSETQTRMGKHDYRAIGKVEVRYQDMLLKQMKFGGMMRTHEVEGQGNVYFEQGNQKVWGEKFKFNFMTKTGPSTGQKGERSQASFRG